MHPRSTLDHTAVGERYFVPRRGVFADPFLVTAAEASQLACFRDVRNPRAPTAVYLHGNGEIVADTLPDFPAWVGVAGANIFWQDQAAYMGAVQSLLRDVA
jgi:hypothetical protein